MLATKIFADRIEPMEKVRKETDNIIHNDFNKKIINFYGIGGIGKTRFMNEFKRSLKNYEMVEHAMVSLDSYELNYPLKVLLNIRKQLKGYNFIKFDHALVQYYSKINTPTKVIVDDLESFQSQFIDLYKQVGDNVLETFVPYFSSIKKLFTSAKKIIKLNHLKKYEEDFSIYENMDTMELFSMLPQIFTESINEKDAPVILLFDDYDSYLRKVKGKSVSLDAEKWLYEIYRKTNRILLLIASRDILKNFETHYIKPSEVEMIRISRLSDEDTRIYLKSIPIEDDLVINTIIEASNGVPLYLDLFANHYIEHNGEFHDISEFEAPKLKELIDRYLSHLNAPEREMVECLSYYDRIENNFIKFVRSKRNIQISDIQLEELLNKTLFIDDDLYQKLDFTLRDHILENKKHCQKDCSSADLLMDYIINEINASNPTYESYLNQLIDMFSEYENLETHHIENWVRIINEIGDRTYFEPFNDSFIDAFKGKSKAHEAIYIYYNLLKTRRVGNVHKGKLLMEELKQANFDFNIYGEMKEALTLLDVFFTHLTGNYQEAFEGYLEIIENHELFDNLCNDKRTLLNAQYKYGDLLFLYGRFKESKDVLMKIDVENNISNATKCDIIRTRAHVYRLNYHFEKADKIYRMILQNKDTTDYRINANITTNIAENLQFFKPHEALRFAHEAIEKNTKINSKMEIGKAYAAKSIAHTMLQEYKEAKDAYLKALEIQTETGYRSGVLFALIAKFLIIYYAPDIIKTSKEDCVQEIKNMWSELGVYKSFGIIIEILMDLKLEETKDIDWLDYDLTYQNLVKILRRN